MLYQLEKEIAIKAVTAAAKLCQQVRQDQGSLTIEKPDRSPVTVADFGAQAVICQALAEYFPADPVVGEEDSALLQLPTMTQQLAQVTKYVKTQVPRATTETVTTWIDRGNGQTAARYWTLDPIDGTKGYVRGDQYAIALALVEEGELKLGVLGCPALPVDLSKPHQTRGVLFVAVRGEGTVMIPLDGGAPTKIHVNDTEKVEILRLAEGVELSHGNAVMEKAVAEAMGFGIPSVHIDSQAKYGVVARGEAALYLRLPSPQSPHRREHIWDHAAGVIVLEEAGGRVTDMYGQPLDFSCGSKLFNNQGIIATNGAIHQAVLVAVAEKAQV
ncbi:3'(2'),5'-bisphosphate nucleotidase [Lyngbya aestuarii]|uniref:3'(2'),5'-bisphosphate nucleotidase n=1 Tax=Lyngbya aestuarii TaxID=118322 RepID=UPI00403DA415